MIDPSDKFLSALVTVVTAHPGIRSKDIAQMLSREHQLEITLPTLYRKISEYVENQILVKKDGLISLNLIWASQFVRFASYIHNFYLTSESTNLHLPEKEGGIVNFEADSLKALDTFWNHILVAIAKKSEGNTLFGYNAHAWYCLGMRESEKHLITSLRDINTNVNLLIGSDNDLDLNCKAIYQSWGINAEASDVATKAKDDLLKQGIVWCSEEFVIEFLMPSMLENQFQFLYKNVQSPDIEEMQVFKNAFLITHPCKIKITKDKKHSNMWKEFFQDFF